MSERASMEEIREAEIEGCRWRGEVEEGGRYL